MTCLPFEMYERNEKLNVWKVSNKYNFWGLKKLE